MIIFSDSTFNVDDYSKEGIEGKLISTMNSSEAKYKFKNADELRFELDLRKNIVNSAVKLSDSEFDFDDFKNSRCNEELWNRTKNGGFRLKDNATPSVAINDIYINGSKYATECATAMMVVYYKALLDIYGDELFNKIFTKIYLMNWNQEEALLKNATVPKKVDDILLGDRVYFDNPDFNPETPVWRGENAIVLPNNLYYGLGIGIITAENMVRILNSKRKPNATRSSQLLDTAGRLDMKKLSDIFYNPPQYSRLVWSGF